MYLYLYDSFLVNPKYRKIIDRIENRIMALSIDGKVTRLTIIKNAREIVVEQLKRGIETVVVVGGDELLFEAASALVENRGVLGFIPIESNSQMAQILGLPIGEAACDVVSARRIQQMDLGKINNQYFLSSVVLGSNNVKIKCESSYAVDPLKSKLIKVSNLDWINFSLTTHKKIIKKEISNPADGLLELIFEQSGGFSLPFFKKKAYKKDSLFYVKNIEITKAGEEEITLTVDQTKIMKTPATIEVAPRVIKIIVGRERMI